MSQTIQYSLQEALFGSSITVGTEDPAGAHYYQVFDLENNPLSKKVELNQTTTIFPMPEKGSKVVVKFVNNDGAVTKEDTIILD
ncbi:hypothetical protein LC040_15630 [Bacillus tianshenii]|nr:hypothetical protein LC040_15630 [Bacillus tianshenii]